MIFNGSFHDFHGILEWDNHPFFHGILEWDFPSTSWGSPGNPQSSVLENRRRYGTLKTFEKAQE
jgi:hypothetical protein